VAEINLLYWNLTGSIEESQESSYSRLSIGFPTEIQKDYLSDIIKRVRNEERFVKSYTKHLLQEIRRQTSNQFYPMHNSIT